jgi:Spy/CpxP family protein refolding chaperone
MYRFELAALAIVAASIALCPAGAGLAESPDADGGVERPWVSRGHRGPGEHGKRERGPERFLEQHADELGLSTETRAAIAEIIEASGERADALRDAGKEDRAKMRSLLQQPLPDAADVMKLVEASNAHKLERSKLRMQAMLDIRKLLTDAQRSQLVGIREARHTGRMRFGAMRGCHRELPEVCPDAEPGRETLACLSEKWDELSEACRGSFEARGRRGFGRRQGGETAED